MGRGAGAHAALDLYWAGARPAWLDRADAALELESVTFVAEVDAAAVVHLPPNPTTTITRARSAARHPGLVLQLGPGAAAAIEPGLGAADAILVDSTWDAGQLAARHPAAAGKISVAPAPIDLDRFAPQAQLLHAHGSLLKRFRRYHRLGEPCLLFVGPYTPEGGLDLAIEAAYLLRERFPDVRLAAIPSGPVDAAFLDRCERRVLGLGHRGIVEWRVEEAELPFWYATATVVCTPWRVWAGAAATTPVRLAAAVGRPFVGSDVAPLRAELEHGSGWATLVPIGNVQALVDACVPLFDEDGAQAGERGAGARVQAEESFSPRAAARRLAASWRSVASITAVPRVA